MSWKELCPKCRLNSTMYLVNHPPATLEPFPLFLHCHHMEDKIEDAQISCRCLEPDFKRYRDTYLYLYCPYCGRKL